MLAYGLENTILLAPLCVPPGEAGHGQREHHIHGSSPKIEAMYSTLIDLGNREIINVKQVNAS